MRWAAWVHVVAGALLAVAPFVLQYDALSSIAMTEAVAVGLLIAGLGLWAALSTTVPAYLDYGLMALGVWSIAAPFALGYHASVELARNADILAGLVVVALAAVSRFQVPETRRKVAA